MNAPETAAPLQLTPTESIRQLLTTYLDKVQALADSRPDLPIMSCTAEVRLSSIHGLVFSPAIFYGEDSLVMAYGEPTIETAVAKIAARLAEIPHPPTREQLKAKLRAELAALEGGQS